MIPAANLAFMWREIDARIGTPYTWGGTLDPHDPSQGTDCSGAVGFVIEALLYGSATNWDRPFWTGTFAGYRPGQVVAPWGLVCIPGPFAGPADAAAVMAINQGPTADTSHMIVRVLDRSLDPEGIDIEDDGRGLQKYDQAASIDDPQFNQWFYLPGPLESIETPRDSHIRDIVRAGRDCGITPRGIVIGLSVALVESNITVYANSNDPASLHLPHEAVGSDHMSVGIFQQQPPWGSLADRMDPYRSAVIFFTVDHGPGVRGLSHFDYNDPTQAPGSFAQAVQGSAYPDRYDERMAESQAIYARLAAATDGGPFMALTDAEQKELLALARQIAAYKRDSRSPLRHLGEHQVDTATGLALNTDGNVHVLLVQRLAHLGDPDALALLREVANADPLQYPDRQHDRLLAQAILNEISSTTSPESAPATGIVPGTVEVPVAPPTATLPAITPLPVASPAGGGDGGVASSVASLEAEITTLRGLVTSLTQHLES